MASLSSPNKRLKHDNSTSQMRLTNLPDGILIKVASYLTQASCISYALTLQNYRCQKMTPSNNGQQPSEIAKAIAAATKKSWESIDMKDIQDIWGRRLTDSDIRWVLICVGALNKTKSLKLTNCLGITGAGLEPLRGSNILERIDLSLVGDYQSPIIQPEPPISVADVLPILESIIETEGNSLVHIQLPKKWRVERGNVLTPFLERFDRALNRRMLVCSVSQCENICETVDHNPFVNWQEQGIYFGTMGGFTCYECMKHFCIECQEDYGIMGFCSCCEKYYCEVCSNVSFCQGDDCTVPYQPSSCEGCDVVKHCMKCDALEPFCPDCREEWVIYTCRDQECDEKYCPLCYDELVVMCQYCDEGYCAGECSRNCMNICRGNDCNRTNCKDECSDKNMESPECVVGCYGPEHDGCEWSGGHTFCLDCRVKECEKDWNESCSDCVKTIAPLLVKENKRLRRQVGSS